MREKMNRQKILTYVLAVLLAVAVGYIAFDKMQASANEQAQLAFDEGYKNGVTNAVVALYQQTENCQAATINIGNITRQVVDTSCLVQAPAQG